MTDKPIIRVFPRRNSHTPRDNLAFIGDPPLFRPRVEDVSEVHISVTFTWDIKDSERLKRAWGALYPVVKMGGPALDSPEGKFIPGKYIKPGVTFTTRGCNRKCPWCRVPATEGLLSEFDDYPPGWIVQDNNFLQASQEHQAGVFEMLRTQPHPIQFAGGIDARLVNPWFAEQLKTIRLGQLFLAADTALAVRDLAKAREVLKDFPRKKLRSYTLIGFGNDTIKKATERLEKVWEIGCIPHAQLYQPENNWIDYSREWKLLSRLWSRPAAMYGMHKATQAITNKVEQVLFD